MGPFCLTLNDGQCSRNSGRSAGFDHNSGDSEEDDVDLGP